MTVTPLNEQYVRLHPLPKHSEGDKHRREIANTMAKKKAKGAAAKRAKASKTKAKKSISTKRPSKKMSKKPEKKSKR